MNVNHVAYFRVLTMTDITHPNTYQPWHGKLVNFIKFDHDVIIDLLQQRYVTTTLSKIIRPIVYIGVHFLNSLRICSAGIYLGPNFGFIFNVGSMLVELPNFPGKIFYFANTNEAYQKQRTRWVCLPLYSSAFIFATT